MSLNIDLREKQVLKIGNATLRLERKSGRVARLNIEAPQEIEIELVNVLQPGSDLPDSQGQEANIN